MLNYGNTAKPYQPYFREEISIPTSVEVDGTTVELNMASISMTDTSGTYTATDYLTVDKFSNKVLYHQNVGKKTLTSDMDWDLLIIDEAHLIPKSENSIMNFQVLSYHSHPVLIHL